MLPADWIKIAEAVKELSECCEGIIVLHGTDTLCYTASALAFMLADTSRRVPVMVTGANQPLEDQDGDGAVNIRDCFTALRSGIFEGVYVCFGGDVHIAAVARKVAVEGNGFISVSGSPAAKICGGQVDTGADLDPPWGGSYHTICGHDSIAINPNVGFYKIYPGFRAGMIAADTSDALVLELYNDGTGPCGVGGVYSIGVNVAKYGKPVFATSQHNAVVTFDTYATSVELGGSGITGLRQMTSETAIVKLMWLLGRGIRGQELIEQMTTDYCYEILAFLPKY